MEVDTQDVVQPTAGRLVIRGPVPKGSNWDEVCPVCQTDLENTVETTGAESKLCPKGDYLYSGRSVSIASAPTPLDVDAHVVDEEEIYTQENVLLGGEIADIEFRYLLNASYQEALLGSRSAEELNIRIAEKMLVSVNGKKVNWESIDGRLSANLSNFAARKFLLGPSKNSARASAT